MIALHTMNLDQYHPTVKKIIDLITTNNMWHEIFEHEAVLTSQEASNIRTGYTIKQGAKAIILRVKETNSKKYFAQFIVPGDERIDSRKLTKLLKVKSLRFANKEEIKKLTDGIQIGGIPPFGNLFNIPVYIDQLILKNEKIIFNAGDRKFSIAIKAKDYLKLVDPQILQFVK